MTLEEELQYYKDTCDFLIKSSCKDQQEIVVLEEALKEVLAILQDCIGDLEYEESDGWMSGKVCVDCYKDALKVIAKYKDINEIQKETSSH